LKALSSPYFIGIDIGTYESKGVITDAGGHVVASQSCPHEMESPKPGYAEHDAEKTWWGDFCELSNGLIARSGVNPSEIKAIGCSTIAPCCLPVDEACRPLRKAILYGVDVRAGKEIYFLEELFGTEHILAEYGMPITSQSAAAKILWIKNNESHIYRNTARFITGTTYLVAKLTGEYVIDQYTAASWVPMYDRHANDWAYGNLDIFCRPGQLAQCRWTNEIAGNVTRQAASETGLAEGTPVSVGTADAAAEAISAGVSEPGDMLLMYGSSIFIIHVTDKFRMDPRLWTGPYLFPGTFAITAGMSTAGTLTRWFRDNLAKDLLETQEKTGRNAYDLLAEETSGIAPGSDGLLVLPYFSGERTPINDPDAKGVIFGLTLRHSRAHVYNACLEGIGYGIAQHFDIFDRMQLETKKIIAVGGGVKNEKWLQIVSNISGRTQCTVEEGIGAAYGDALLAALSIGIYHDVKDIGVIVRQLKSIVPVKEEQAKYQHYKNRYAELYSLTRKMMHEL